MHSIIPITVTESVFDRLERWSQCHVLKPNRRTLSKIAVGQNVSIGTSSRTPIIRRVITVTRFGSIEDLINAGQANLLLPARTRNAAGQLRGNLGLSRRIGSSANTSVILIKLGPAPL